MTASRQFRAHLTTATHPATGLSFALGVGGTHQRLRHERIRQYQVNQRLLGPEQSTLYISDRDNDQNVLGTYRQGRIRENVADRISALTT